MPSEAKYLLTEAYRSTSKTTGFNPVSPKSFFAMLENNRAFNYYTEALSENMTPQVRSEFRTLARSSRIALLENSTYGLVPYQTLTMPVLSVFYPRLIARELVNVDPIDKPEVIKAFLQPVFTKWNNPNQFAGPSYNNISTGPDSASLPQPLQVNMGQTNLLQVFNLNSEVSHIERDLSIYQVNNASGQSADVQIIPDDSGNFAAQVTVNGQSDVITGNIDYYSGVLTIQSTTGVVKSLNLSVSTSLEENTINPYVNLVVNKIKLTAKDRELSAQWSVQFEQDIRALYNIDLQAELVNIMGQQIALDIDREIVNTLIAIANNNNLTNATHRQTFSWAAPSTFQFGQKAWYANVIPVLTQVSASIFTDTNIQAGDLIACNPVDASLLESIDGFTYEGTSQDGGDLSFRTGYTAGRRWKVLTSPIVPMGQMIVTYRPSDEMKSVFLYAPYVPAIIQPYPMMNKPAMTILSRYAMAPVRPNGLGIVQLTGFNNAYGNGTVQGFNGVYGGNTN
jgi:hypothetical protein